MKKFGGHYRKNIFILLCFLATALLCALPAQASYFMRVNKDGFGNMHNTGGLDLKTMAVFQGKLYAGVSNQVDGAQVLAFDGSAWQQINESGFGERDNIAVSCMLAAGKVLYAGTSNRNGGQVWFYDGSRWQCLHQDRFGQTMSNSINSMAFYRGKLYVGLWDQVTSRPAEIWAFDGEAAWQQVNEPGFGSPANLNTTAMEVSRVDGKEKLYALVWKSFQYKGADAGCEVWAYDEKKWTKVNAGREGFGEKGLGRAGVEPFSMAEFQGKLHVGLWGFNTGEPWEVWAYDGKDWQQVNKSIRNKGTRLLLCLALMPFKDRLFAVAADGFNDFELWSYDGASWDKLVGEKCALPDKLGDAGNKAINAMAVFRDRLYLGVANQKSGYQVWESRFPEISPRPESLLAGEIELFTVAGACPPVSWSSSNPAAAVIDQHTGFVSAVSKGKSLITAKDSFGYCFSPLPVKVSKKIFAASQEKSLIFPAAAPPALTNGSSARTLITARVYATRGAQKITSVKADLSSLNLGAALLVDDGTEGDTIKDDALFSRMITLPADIKPGTYAVPVAAHSEAGVQASGAVILSVKQGYTVPEITDVRSMGKGWHIPVLFNLIDPDKDSCSVKVEYKKESGPWMPASIESASGTVISDTQKKEGDAGAAAKNVLSRLATSLAINPYVLVWQSEKDAENESGMFTLRLTPQDGKTRGKEISTKTFFLDNRKPLADEMVYVPAGNFSIDTYEYPNRFGYYPAANITWHEARKACQERGKDVCTAGQWEAAYYGSAKKRYPYGDTYGFEDRKFCNTQGSADDVPVPSGLYESCVNDLGLYDMGGNLYEWVGHDEKNSLMADQSYKTEAMVQSLFNIDEAAHRHEYLGFRCCSCEQEKK